MQAAFGFIVAAVVMCGALSSSAADETDVLLEFTCPEQSATVKLKNTVHRKQEAFQCNGSIAYSTAMTYIDPPGRTEISVTNNAGGPVATIICRGAAGAWTENWFQASTGEGYFRFYGCEVAWAKGDPAVSVSFTADE